MTAVERFLLACVREQPAAADLAIAEHFRPDDWQAFLALAQRQRVRPLIYEHLQRSTVVPSEVMADLERECRAIALKNLRMFGELRSITAALDDAGIAVLLLKGAHIASYLYGGIGARELGDLDVLVPRHRIRQAIEIARDLGYAPYRPFDVDADLAVSHHITGFHRASASVLLELHWNVTEPGQPYTITPDDLWRRSVGFSVGDRTARVLSDEDLLLHLCLHCAYQHRFEFGLRSLCDIARLLTRRAEQLDWDSVWHRAERWHWTRGVTLALRLTGELFGVGAPGHVCAALRSVAVPTHVISAAADHLMHAEPPSRVLTRDHGRLGDAQGLLSKARFLAGVVFRPKSTLRHAYPHIQTFQWTWWIFYLMRCRDLLRRHGLKALKTATGDRELKSFAGRQRALRQFLLD